MKSTKTEVAVDLSKVAAKPGGVPAKLGKSRNQITKAKLLRVVPFFESIGLNPLAEAVKDIQACENASERANLWLKLCAYIYPTAKEEKIAQDPNESVKIAEDAFNELKKREQAEMPAETTPAPEITQNNQIV
jgi:hypothetical protein